MDISTRITHMARKNLSQNGYNSRIENINCDVRHLPFKSNHFDLIVSDSTLDHFGDRREIAVSLSELYRVLAPGGTLIVTMDNKANITEPLFRLWIKLCLSPFFIGDTYNIKQLKTELARTGFLVVGETAIIHNPRYFTKVFIKILRWIHRNRFERFIGRILDQFDGLETKRTRYLTAQFIAVKAKKP